MPTRLEKTQEGLEKHLSGSSTVCSSRRLKSSSEHLIMSFINQMWLLSTSAAVSSCSSSYICLYSFKWAIFEPYVFFLFFLIDWVSMMLKFSMEFSMSVIVVFKPLNLCLVLVWGFLFFISLLNFSFCSCIAYFILCRCSVLPFLDGHLKSFIWLILDHSFL